MLISLRLRVSYALHPTRCLIKDTNAKENTIMGILVVG
jgi:hypothetical protein